MSASPETRQGGGYCACPSDPCNTVLEGAIAGVLPVTAAGRKLHAYGEVGVGKDTGAAGRFHTELIGHRRRHRSAGDTGGPDKGTIMHGSGPQTGREAVATIGDIPFAAGDRGKEA